MGEQIYDIFKYLPGNVQVALFSATLAKDILELTTKFIRSPISRILVKKDELTLEGIRQFYVWLESNESWKLDCLCDLYECLTITQCIIYCNTRRKADWLARGIDVNRCLWLLIMIYLLKLKIIYIGLDGVDVLVVRVLQLTLYVRVMLVI